MIHNENHPEDGGWASQQAAFDQVHAHLRNKLHRLRNPPWWDLIGRSSNWGMRLEKALVEDDPKARRYVMWSAVARLVVGFGILFAVALNLTEHWWTAVLPGAIGVMVSSWALSMWLRASAHERGYERGVRDGLQQARAIVRGED